MPPRVAGAMDDKRFVSLLPENLQLKILSLVTDGEEGTADVPPVQPPLPAPPALPAPLALPQQSTTVYLVSLLPRADGAPSRPAAAAPRAGAGATPH